MLHSLIIQKTEKSFISKKIKIIQFFYLKELGLDDSQ